MKTRPTIFALMLVICGFANILYVRAAESDATNVTSNAGISATNFNIEAATNTETIATNVDADAQASTNTDTAPAPELGDMPITAVASSNTAAASADNLQQIQILLDLGREQRRNKDLINANKTLVSIIETNAPAELKRVALFELALVAQDGNQLVRAQQIFAQYVHLYPSDPTVPEVMLREGLIYRQMGVTTLAVSKFYAVMSTALRLKLDNIEYYKKLVLQAQFEIADTYYLEGNYDEAADFFSRLLKNGSSDLDKVQIHYKLIRSLSVSTNNAETAAKAEVFLQLYTNSIEVPEVRFLLASALKKLGHNHEAMKQVLLLLQSEQDNVQKNPDVWIYWQQKAGNEIAGDFYKEGDYLSALQIYLTLADLDKSPAWQFPIWYQMGLVYEQLLQPQKASDTYDRILSRQKELTGDNSSPSLQSLIDMAKWRKDYIAWLQKARLANQPFQPSTNALSLGTP